MGRPGRGTAVAWDRNDDVPVALHRSRQADLLVSGKLDPFDLAADDVTVLTHASLRTSPASSSR